MDKDFDNNLQEARDILQLMGVDCFEEGLEASNYKCFLHNHLLCANLIKTKSYLQVVPSRNDFFTEDGLFLFYYVRIISNVRSTPRFEDSESYLDVVSCYREAARFVALLYPYMVTRNVS